MLAKDPKKFHLLLGRIPVWAIILRTSVRQNALSNISAAVLAMGLDSAATMPGRLQWHMSNGRPLHRNCRAYHTIQHWVQQTARRAVAPGAVWPAAAGAPACCGKLLLPPRGCCGKLAELQRRGDRHVFGTPWAKLQEPSDPPCGRMPELSASPPCELRRVALQAGLPRPKPRGLLPDPSFRSLACGADCGTCRGFRPGATMLPR